MAQPRRSGATRRRLIAFALALAAGAASAQSASADALEVTRPDGTPFSLAAAQFAALPHESFSATAHGKTSAFSGVDLREVLKAAGVAWPEAVRGELMRRIVVVRATDGYAVPFSFAELDPALGNRRVFVVDRADDAPLVAAEGPWRLVVPADAHPTRWARQVRRLVVSDLP